MLWCKVLVVNVVFIKPCPALYREAGIEAKIGRVLKGILKVNIIFTEREKQNKSISLVFYNDIVVYVEYAFSDYCLYFPCSLAFPNRTVVILTVSRALVKFEVLD